MKVKLNYYSNFLLVECFASQGETYPIFEHDCKAATLGYYYSGNCEWSSSNTKFNMTRGDFSPFVNSIEEDLANINVPEYDKISVNVLSDLHWVCMQEIQESPGYVKNGSCVTISTNQTVPAGNGVFVLDGAITANDNGNLISLTKFDYINPRTYEYSLSGDGKAFLLQTT
jgi:hypothetical protein